METKGAGMRLSCFCCFLDFVQGLPFGNSRAQSNDCLSWGYLCEGVAPAPHKGQLLEQCKENIVLGHRSREHMRSLISPLKDIVNVFFNGQLVP